MAKINIAKPTGSVENLELLTAFKADGMTYIIFDSDKIGSMGLPIIYVCKFINEKLEKIIDANEWQTVKNYLKGIINGTSFEYIKVASNLNADEAYFMPLTLPQASFDLIKSRYIVKEDNENNGAVASNPSENIANPPLETLETTLVNEPINKDNVVTPNTTPEAKEEVVAPTITPAAPSINTVPNETPSAPVMPNNNIVSNSTINISPALNEPVINNPIENSPVAEVNVNNSGITNNNFLKDKEMFLKACENMFDALISKYEKKFSDLETKEQQLKEKEQEIEAKLHNANEHLANAEAREQVANIAHDNAQRVMDISGLMPQNPSNNTADVI